jgi:hypothetical protein
LLGANIAWLGVKQKALNCRIKIWVDASRGDGFELPDPEKVSSSESTCVVSKG